VKIYPKYEIYFFVEKSLDLWNRACYIIDDINFVTEKSFMEVVYENQRIYRSYVVEGRCAGRTNQEIM
jgi:hypothetical protein